MYIKYILCIYYVYIANGCSHHRGNRHSKFNERLIPYNVYNTHLSVINFMVHSAYGVT